MKLFIATITLSLSLSLSMSGSVLAQSKTLPAPALFDAKGQGLAMLNPEAIEASGDSVTINLAATVRDAGVPNGWTLYVLDFQKQEIIWSKEGKGPPPTKIEWNARSDDGKLPDPGRDLGFKLVLQTDQGSKSSEVLKVSVAEGDSFWRMIDRGLHVYPKGAIGFYRMNLKSASGDFNKSFSLYPVTTSELGFHYNRLHYFGISLENAARILEKGADVTYSHGAAYYQVALVQSSGGGIEWQLGAQGFGRKIGTAPENETRDDPDAKPFYVFLAGAAVATDVAWKFTEDKYFKLGLKYGQGTFKGDGDITTVEASVQTPLTSHISLQTTLGIDKMKAKALEGDKAQYKIDSTFARIYLNLVI